MTTGADASDPTAARPNTRTTRLDRAQRAARRARPLALAVIVGIAGCTAVNPTTVKEQRDSGVTRDYSRPPADLYQAAVRGLEDLREDPNWRGLEITERDPAQGYVIAERPLDSAVIPGLGERDAIGVFVAPTSDGDSAVTVVRMSSDQVPGSVGTSINSARDASGLIFPAIDAALATIPETPRDPVSAAPVATRPVAPPPSMAPGPAVTAPAAALQSNAPVAAPLPVAAAGAASTLDRVYATLRAGGTWRPLVREVSSSGDEEIRIGGWVALTAEGDRVRMSVKSKDGSPVDAARLALELERAGFRVDVEAARAR